MTREEKVLRLKQDFDEVFDAGKQAEYDAFWDAFQRKGSQTSYVGVFGGECWNNGLLKPKYNIDYVINASFMFYYNTMGGDLVEYFKSIGKIFSLEGTGARNLNSTFQYSYFTRVGKMHTSGDNWYSTFYGCKNLVTIDEVGNGDENGNVLIGTSTFNGCTALENITIRGKIVNNTSFQWSTKLTRASIESIINHLSDATNGATLTLSKTAVLNAFELSEVEEGWFVGTYIEEWLALTSSKTNWTITLV